ncbi:anthranilate 1,2-dioxygenase system ferredoxin--NAD(+) reductase [Burkholderia sp. PAMC 26561]|uniref:anthranilate 1,2-dioxygenase system ferredoxin--NAD(+) reductase n=1 Tax=Burkholderia sp. PAMC 26561 TaxID=1795043 RepID=UPI00076B7402|nr:anthranilate 1,2-dioxygenase system ferredoxin--NAD(+) reductase [Burkholderia sp. PAMC 26561]AME28410.1 pyridine nucleotide-disulfide oxidoreductase [Burkholderia sp. PAMC 26561]
MSNDAYVIVGAGHAARRAAETLRLKAPECRILMIGEEAELPYDRPALSKDALLGIEGEQRAFMHNADWYGQQRIEMRLGIRVAAIDREQRCVYLGDGKRVGYQRLLIATGSRVRRFSGPVDEGVKLHYVRTVADARALREALIPGARVTVLGGGFIGLEVAASAVSRGCAVTVIEPANRLLHRSMPADLGAFMLGLHRRHGVDMQINTTPIAIEKTPSGAVVKTDCGDVPADVVVIGIGVVPNVDLAASAGLLVDNGIVVDQHCRTADPLIFAAGEVTSHFNALLGRHLRVESWQVAENQPAVAAANMLGGEEHYAEMPWLWSDQYDCNLQTLGIFAAHQSVIKRGDPEGDVFCMLALGKDDRLEAVMTVNCGWEVAVCRRLMAGGKALDRARLADPGTPLKALLK